jgi:phage gpG-like protein
VLSIEVEISGFGRVERMAHALETFARSRSFLLGRLASLIRKQHVRRVLSEKTSPSGAAWKPLKPSTIKRKGHANILVESGKMAWAWQQTISGDTVMMCNTARSARGRNVLYLPFHQYGTKKMVARPVMGFSAANLTEIAVVVNSFVASRLGVAA